MDAIALTMLNLASSPEPRPALPNSIIFRIIAEAESQEGGSWWRHEQEHKKKFRRVLKWFSHVEVDSDDEDDDDLRVWVGDDDWGPELAWLDEITDIGGCFGNGCMADCPASCLLIEGFSFDEGPKWNQRYNKDKVEGLEDAWRDVWGINARLIADGFKHYRLGGGR